MKTKTKRFNKTYNRRLTKHQHAKAKHYQITILLAIALSAVIIGHQSLKPIFTPDRPAPPSILIGRLPINQNKPTASLTIPDRIRIIARQENFKWPDYLVRLSYCESRHDPLAIGDQGNSRGLFQIHKKYHPEVSTLQAFNIEYATKWTINMINAGKQGQWSCNKIILAENNKDAKYNIAIIK
jgi:hypothetical protein